MGAQVSARVNDAIYRRLKYKGIDVGLPEYRIPLILVAYELISIGLFWHGRSAVGTVIVGAETIVRLQKMRTSIVDSYTRFAASRIAAAVVLRNLAGIGFPLFAPYMYDALGYG